MRGEHRQTSGYPQDPPGDELVEQVLEGEEKQEALRRAAALPRLMVDREAEITLEMIATGVFSPITGFLPRVENESVLEEGRLTDGTPWPIPLSMAPTGRRNREVLAGLAGGEEIALVNQRGETVALLEVEDIYEYDREHRAERLFGTVDPEKHPGVAGIFRRMGEWGLAGRIHLVDRPSWGAFEKYRMTPRQTRELLYADRGVESVAGFITGANPLHVGHEYMHRTVLEQVDRILLLPQVAMERPEYIKAHHRVMAMEALRGVYYPMHRVLINALRTTYLFAGPRGAVLQAIVLGTTDAPMRSLAAITPVWGTYMTFMPDSGSFRSTRRVNSASSPCSSWRSSTARAAGLRLRKGPARTIPGTACRYRGQVSGRSSAGDICPPRKFVGRRSPMWQFRVSSPKGRMRKGGASTRWARQCTAYFPSTRCPPVSVDICAGRLWNPGLWVNGIWKPPCWTPARTRIPSTPTRLLRWLRLLKLTGAWPSVGAQRRGISLLITRRRW